MIQIDDAGSGSLIGGTCIGAMRVESREYYYEIIPLSFYKKETFSQKLYLNKAKEICISLLKKLNISRNEKIEICRGYMFDKVKPWLKENHYLFISTTINNPLQSQIENTFESYAVSLGLPKEFIAYTKYPFHFHRLLRWIYADYENRKKLCKIGWKSWEKYGNLQLKIDTFYLKKSNYRCLKCWKPIKDNSLVKRIYYISNRPNHIYLHINCYKTK